MSKIIVLRADEIDRTLGKGTSFLKARKVRILVHKMILNNMGYEEFKILDFERSYVRKSREKPYVFEIELVPSELATSNSIFEVLAMRIETLLRKGPEIISPP